MTVLVQATAHSPQITTEDIAVCASMDEFQHMRDMISQAATQVGHNQCTIAFDRLADAETRWLYND